MSIMRCARVMGAALLTWPFVPVSAADTMRIAVIDPLSGTFGGRSLSRNKSGHFEARYPPFKRAATRNETDTVLGCPKIAFSWQAKRRSQASTNSFPTPRVGPRILATLTIGAALSPVGV
jgi:hypothetical protein